MVAASVSGCGHRAVAARPGTAGGPPGASLASRAAGEAPLRVAVLPLDNAAGAAVPSKELHALIERRLATRFEVVAGAPLDEFLSRHRLRYTGGIDAEAARAGREELGLDAFLLTTVESYRTANPPVLGLTMRLVATGEEPVILWIDHAVRGGEDRPGLLRLGVLEREEQVREVVLERLLASLDRSLRGEEADAACSAGRSYRPRVRFRSALLGDGRPHTVAVVPFLNQSSRRNAGELVTLEFVRQLVRGGRYNVLEPGVVRDYMLRSRIMIPGGVSLETTRLFLGALGVDLVLSGTVLDYLDSGNGGQNPSIRFTATMLDGGSGELVWHSTSFNRGDDGVFAFGLGRVRTAGDLTCRMVASVVERMDRHSASDLPPRLLDADGDPKARLGPTRGNPSRR